MDQTPRPPPGYQIVPNDQTPTPPPGYKLVANDQTAPAPDSESWGQWIKNSIVGRQDPKYADVPSIYSQNKGLLADPTGNAALLGASDDQMSDVISKKLGDKYLGTETDANGYPVIRYKDDQGGQKLGYVNKPGLDTEDVARGVRGVLPYALGSEVLGPAVAGYGLLTRMAAQGALGTATSVAGDKALEPMGSKQGIDPDKALAMGWAGPLSELGGTAAGALYQRFKGIPKYFNAATGELTPAGQQAAQSLGLDPAQLTADAAQTFAKTYAASPSDAAAFVNSGRGEFNIPATRGQNSKDPTQLMQEKIMRSGAYGYDAQHVIQDLDQQQQDAIDKALSQTIPQRISGVSSSASGGSGGEAPSVYGANISANLADAKAAAKGQEDAAWKNVPKLIPNAGATATIPDFINNKLGDFTFDDVNTPTAYNMAKQINSFMQGKAPTTDMDPIIGRAARDQDAGALRKQLVQIRANAQTPTDKVAASSIYHGFNDWINDAANKSLFNGADPLAAAKLFTAVDHTAEMNQVFKPSQGGRLSPGGKIIQSIQNSAATPEKIVDMLLPTVNQAPQPGQLEAMRLIKQATNKYGTPEAAKQTWGSIKLAHLAKLTQGKDGEWLTPTVQAKNLRKAMHSQISLFNTLYTPADRALLNRYLNEMDRISWKDPNPSGTATGIAILGKQLIGTFMNSFGTLGKAAWEMSGAKHAYGTALARKAVAQTPVKIPTLATNASRFGVPAAAIAAQQQQKQSR